ncbi:MAG: sugar transferase, partial [Deltaproteobacteria bacterium]|nr:sugar transferase [Deltaproteobacteria bacterium]
MRKRLIDVAGALIGLFLAMPLFVAVGAAIKLTSRGPVFYRGVRTGLHGKPFRIFKFRTMVTDAEKLGGPTTGTDDPRVTRVGRFLR